MTDNNNATPNQTSATRRMRWSWFPSLLFGDGMLPSVLMLTLLMFHRYGLNNATAALYIALLASPLILRPLFEMVVTHFRGTTKVWILASEFISALSLWAIAFTLPTAYWLQGAMSLLPFFVTSGVFYNIATNRFYLELPSETRQSRSLFALLFRSVALLFGMGAVAMLAGNMEVVTRNVRYSWSFVFYLMAGVEFFLWLWHSIFLPGGKRPWAEAKDLAGLHRNDYNTAVESAVTGWHNRVLLYFFVLFALPEAMLAVTAPLFLVDAPHNGGMGLAPQEFGLTGGTIAIIALAAGGMAGTRLIRRFGIRRSLAPLSAVLAAHGAALIFLSYNLASTLAVVSLALIVGNTALGMGMAAYMSVAYRFAESGVGHTFRHAVAMSLMSLTVVATSLFAGLLQENIGYRQFFTIAEAMYAVTFAIAIICTFSLKQGEK